MRATPIDWGDDILRRVFFAIIPIIPLVYVLGAPALLLLVVPPIVGLGIDRVRRPGDVANKLFSFCLPGFRESLRRRYFAAAAIVGLGVSVLSLLPALFLRLRYPSDADVEPIQVGLSMVAAFGVGMVLAFVMGTLRFVLSRLAWSLIGLLSIPLFLLAVILFPLFIEYWLVGIPLCAAASVFVWFRLGDLRRLKRAHRAILEDALERRPQAGVTKTAAPWVEDLFQERMEHHDPRGTAGYLWGSLYGTFGLPLSYWKWIQALIVAEALMLGYAPPWFAGAVFVGMGLLVRDMRLPAVFAGTWLPLGRRERRRATIVVAAATALLLVGFAVLVTVCTWFFSLFLPALGGRAYAGIDPWLVGLANTLVPWLLGCRLLRYMHPGAANLMASAAAVLAVAMVWLWSIAGIAWAGPLGIGLLTAAVLAGWPFFLGTLHALCARASLVAPSACEEAA